MTGRSAAPLAIGVVTAACAALVAGAVLFAMNRSAGLTGSIFSPSNVVQELAGSLAFLGVGAIVAAKRPANAVGWLCLALGALGCLAWAGEQFAGYAVLADPGSLPGGVAVAVAQEAGFAPQLVLLLLVVVLFPDGRLPSPRWRVVPAGATLGFAILYAVGLTQEPSAPFETVTNPLTAEGSPVVAVALVVAIPLAIASVAAAVASVVVRFRRSHGDERAQLKWVVFAAAWLPALLVAHSIGDAVGVVPLGVIELLFSVVAVGIPAAIGVAILKYRLYDIDRIISRALVYGALTIVLALVYVGLVLAGQAMFASFAGGSNLAIAASTLVVAALFLPVRARVQGFVDRRFYRRRYDAQRTLAAFSSRLRETVDLEALHAELRAVVEETVQPNGVTVWRQGGSS